MESKSLEPSRFNCVVLDGSRLVLFNSFSGALAEFLGTSASKVIGLLSGEPLEEAGEASDEALLKRLADAGFLVEAGTDELASVRSWFNVARFRNESITAVPVVACNMACSYCRLGELPSGASRMSETVINAIASLYGSSTNLLQQLYVTGGEPLLATSEVLGLVRQCRDAARRVRKPFRAILVTNGYLLTPDISVQLAASGISRVQVTMDGPPEIHDRRRPLRNGAGTFERIGCNVEGSAGAFREGILVRVNSDPEAPDAFRFIGKWAESLKNVDYYTALTTSPSSDTPSASTENSLALFRAPGLIERSCMLPLKHRTGCCPAVSYGSMVVNPDGSILKCWHEIADPSVRPYGNVVTGDFEVKRLDRWLAWDPTVLEPCASCSLLPVCMGGCPAENGLDDGSTCGSIAGRNSDEPILRYCEALKKNQLVDACSEAGQEGAIKYNEATHEAAQTGQYAAGVPGNLQVSRTWVTSNLLRSSLWSRIRLL